MGIPRDTVPAVPVAVGSGSISGQHDTIQWREPLAKEHVGDKIPTQDPTFRPEQSVPRALVKVSCIGDAINAAPPCSVPCHQALAGPLACQIRLTLTPVPHPATKIEPPPTAGHWHWQVAKKEETWQRNKR